ncbi:OB-fold domain-containing protein [Rhodoferax sp.]|uniref:Zn-ribbon domain-containing OB-fold protein n=1 Tax=Rhodoferax sp. TaxID=50421 RepID=UPI00344BCD6A
MGIRTLPVLTPLNTSFWTAGRDRHLCILRCCACSSWIHPPAPICPDCLGLDLRPQPVSDHGVVEAFTVNHQAWIPDEVVPYIVAIVSLNDCPGVRLTTNIVGASVEELRIGMPVRVLFEECEDVWLPLFTPA